MVRQPAVYILASKPFGVLYTGVTGDLMFRIGMHRFHHGSLFTSRYKIDMLVYYELLADMPTAIRREKQIKGGSRAKKIQLIERLNPSWRDLYPDICQ
jgi:predicted GIY-YIG superfamily endonuclease